MLTSDDLRQMRGEGLELIGDNSVEVAIRRGTTTLPAQTIRLLRRKAATALGNQPGNETRANTLVMGATTLDIAINDRFTTGGMLYRVVFVQPDKRAATFAEVMLEV